MSDHNWIQTATGRQFWPLQPKAEDVCIEDIAHALANKCRFTGHVKDFYSVAQHSVYVSYFVPDCDKLCGLLHDATEAYLPDVSRPVKHQLANFKEIEDRLHQVIGNVFGLDWPMPETVKRADDLLLVTERRDLMSGRKVPWSIEYDVQPLPFVIDAWTPEVARREFLDRFESLVKERVKKVTSSPLLRTYQALGLVPRL